MEKTFKYVGREKEYMQEYNRRYYAEHRETMLLYWRERYKQIREEELKRRRELYHRNPEKYRRRNFWSHWVRWRMIDGCCLLCGEINPFALEKHHVFKGNNFQITLCGTCHNILHTAPSGILIERVEKEGV